MAEHAASARARPATISGRWVVAVLIIGPILAVTVITVIAFANAWSKEQPPAVGAGAGRTGMHNEYGGIGKQPAAK